MHAEDVAASVLDVAFAEDAPQALNIVNPQRPPWVKIMSSIRDAVLEKKTASLTRNDLTMVSFVDWVVQLEKRADSATPEDLVNIVSVFIDVWVQTLMSLRQPAIKLLEFYRDMARHEELTQSETQVGEAGMADFSTAKAQRVSKTVAHMQPLGDADARAWVNYWSSAGLF